MILVADGGSTKTEWKEIGPAISDHSVVTAGINPYFLSADEIYKLIRRELKPSCSGIPQSIFFYGTGCNSDAKNASVEKALQMLFPGCKIFIGSDLLGAARSLCLDKPGIACIIGTGSNSCYFDGAQIVANVAPLGYILGDEGGAAVLGRKLVSGVLKKQVSGEVIDAFFSTYNMTRADILDSVYTKPFPNRFLGQFSKFISANIEFPELQEIIISSFDEFITRNILQYPESASLPVHFTGSIAWHFRSFLEDRLSKNNLKAGKITLSPMADLANYHLTELKKEHNGRI